MKRRSASVREVLVVGGTLALGVIAWEHWLHAYLLGLPETPQDSLRHWLRDSLMVLPVGLASAVIARLWARVLRLRRRPGDLLARALLASVIFALLLVPSAPIHNGLDAGETDTSLTGQMLHGLHDALLGEVVALPLAAGALLLLALLRLRPRSRGPFAGARPQQHVQLP
jgi:hypothetical protein